MQCHELTATLARLADDEQSLAADVRAQIRQHLDTCGACREALEAQRGVAAWLRTRPADVPSPQFAARLSTRLDQVSGWFGIADWRAWTLRLAPVAAALALATYLGVGAAAQSTITLDDWTMPATDGTAAAVLLQSDVTADSVVETMLTGDMPAGSGGSGDAR
jgi:hypothetical protein